MFSDFTSAKAISLKESSARSCVGVLHKVLCKLDHIRRFTKNNRVGLKYHSVPHSVPRKVSNKLTKKGNAS